VAAGNWVRSQWLAALPCVKTRKDTTAHTGFNHGPVPAVEKVANQCGLGQAFLVTPSWGLLGAMPTPSVTGCSPTGLDLDVEPFAGPCAVAASPANSAKRDTR